MLNLCVAEIVSLHVFLALLFNFMLHYLRNQNVFRASLFPTLIYRQQIEDKSCVNIPND